MDKILNTPNVPLYNVANHNIFHQQCLGVCQRHEGIIDEPTAILLYGEKVRQEEYIYKWMQGEKYTEKKAEIDKLRDDIYMGLTAAIRAAIRNFDLSVRDAANHVYKLLNNYGDVAHANYDAETIAIDSIITHLQSDDYIQDVNLLNLQPWMDKLNEVNTQFKQYVEETHQEAIKKPQISAKESRKQTDEALQKITSRVEALITLNNPDTYMPFVREYNELVEHYNLLVKEHYGRIHVRTNIDAAYIEPIPTQTFTGKPIFVIPEVKLTKKTTEGVVQEIELVFLKDFIASYKNNINHGTATITIKGIGKYKGKLVTTFNISD
jgi:hypothetical protein